LVDLGANTDPTAQNLAQFAMLGSIYAERVLGIKRPRVALVSNGEEIEKGNELVKAATPLLQASGLNFIGNVEGKDIPKGVTDVIVTDGFTGNVILKLTEGLVSFLAKTVKETLTNGVLNKIGLVLMIPGLILMLPGLLFLLPAMQRMRKRVDYRELGAAPLLGVDGVVLIAHGRSDAKAIRGAIRSTIRAAEGQLVETVKSQLSQTQPPSGSTPAAQA
jgi:phosphate acyltransferase